MVKKRKNVVSYSGVTWDEISDSIFTPFYTQFSSSFLSFSLSLSVLNQQSTWTIHQWISCHPSVQIDNCFTANHQKMSKVTFHASTFAHQSFCTRFFPHVFYFGQKFFFFFLFSFLLYCHHDDLHDDHLILNFAILYSISFFPLLLFFLFILK